MLCRDFLLELLRSGFGIVGSHLFLVGVLAAQLEVLLGRGGAFGFFGDALGFKVAVGFLEGAEDRDIVGEIDFFAAVVLLLVGLQFDGVLLLLGILKRLVGFGQDGFSFVLEYSFQGEN